MPSPVLDLPWSLLRCLSRVRVFVARHPVVYWTLVGTLAATAALAVDERLDGVADARAAWGTSRSVLVAVRDIESGASVDSRSVVSRVLPVAALADDTLDAVPAGAVALHRIVAGEVVLGHHVAPGTGAAGRLPEGMSGILVPTSSAGLPLTLGDVVDVVAIDDPLGAQAGGGGSVLAADGLVIGTTDNALVIAVDDTEAAGAAAAAASGRAVLVLRRTPAAPRG